MLRLVLCAFLGLASMAWAHPQFTMNKKALCESMAPFHGVEAQPAETFRENFVISGSGVGSAGFSVELAATNVGKKGIKGFMIEARDACTDEILDGTWSSPSGPFSATEAGENVMQCDDKALNTGKNAIHHASTDSAKLRAKKSVKFSWTPQSSRKPKSFKFTATVVHDKTTFWQKQDAVLIPCKQ